MSTNKIVGLDYLINYRITQKKNQRKKKRDERTKVNKQSEE